ncbi:Magnesium transporter MgtE [Thalassocella blandensis]|nr:Magnesium transporter MgtE [Thalassocella blandensis]
MASVSLQHDNPLYTLNFTFLLNNPVRAARKIESMHTHDAAEIMADQPTHVLLPVLSNIAPGVVDSILLALPEQKACEVMAAMDAGPCAALLSRLEAEDRTRFLQMLDSAIAKELEELLAYPEDTAGKVMSTRITAFNENINVGDAIAQIKNLNIEALHHLFLLDDAMRLHAQVDIQRLVLADHDQKLSTLARPIQAYVTVLEPKDEVVEKLKNLHLDIIPVIDGSDHLLGVIHAKNLIDTIQENIAADMQTMVGASKDERALSSSWFAVKKRQPWLQINLITAFLAAAVVGMFEATIAKYTALAILLPIAAGQSGNTGAQALAVTMRGLTLREITVRHWLQVLMKEAGAGVINGIAIAITCGVGVYVWSQSVGLALIIALAMVSSMTIAAVSGALVPIILKRLGQDPALSSSIILTTVTDIAGFMSFLGIATALSFMLTAS